MEHHLRVARTARYYTIGGPVAVPGAAPAVAQDAAADDGSWAPREVWVVCHGYAQLARSFVRAFAVVADATRLIVAPEALNRFYAERAPGVSARDARVAATWMTREDRAHEVADYVAYLDAVAERVTQDVAYPLPMTALGFSQGAATVSRWAALGATPLARVVLWGAGPAHDLPLGPSTFRGAELTLVSGIADEHMGAADVARLQQRLTDAGTAYTLHRYDGGHRIDADVLRRLAGP
jgi:predicted esterase